ncbi:interactor of constitutive active ROPs 4-like [Zingiber officinale]|uniref:interactor of constitutive active ROPs 4-like n=1 Tax=Zingiber officinale TaxID=94328 RepID=UPI001C4BC035|nr:interactor of constitutive active ROPs 4-like [Zingiber officinale]XP_042394331.1 interactor of constitutive active ROPs 4-like [Zingiber officinale]XP_042394332.1 interactor of constitutive active ROPs 4-like [Zingiber officinale]XP_042394333.1 interactor of constitutive active ROPs 4-like [Zingiber officinale]XP_042394334.1 interactor of constitutive active ROPs 4-like [Zingiber officinale]
MSRSRGSDERPQRSLPRAPLHLRSIGFAEANTVSHHLDDAAAVADRSYKVSSRIVSHERKWGTSVVELETKLSKAQAELKKLKDRLASAEAAEVETEKALAKAKKRLPAASVDAKGAGVTPPLARDSRSGDARQNDKGHSVTSPATMDVFEVVVPVGPLPVVDEVDGEERKEEKEVMEGEGEETKGMIEKTEREEASSSVAEKDEEEKEVRILKSKLLAKEKELAIRLEENMIFKIKAEEQAKKLAESAQTTQEQLMAQLNSMEEELKQSKTKEQQLNSQLEAAEGENTSLEMELKRTKVQMDQWRKAAEAAAEVLATGNEASAETGDKRLVERCMSMDKHLGVIAGAMEENDNGGGVTRKSAGARLFGNLLWKKNQQN